MALSSASHFGAPWRRAARVLSARRTHANRRHAQGAAPLVGRERRDRMRQRTAAQSGRDDPRSRPRRTHARSRRACSRRSRRLSRRPVALRRTRARGPPRSSARRRGERRRARAERRPSGLQVQSWACGPACVSWITKVLAREHAGWSRVASCDRKASIDALPERPQARFVEK